MKVVVVGAGRMGHGIAQVAAMAGHTVGLIDIDRGALERALERIRWSLRKFAEKGVVAEEEINLILSRIRTDTGISGLVGDADLIIEAVPEDFQVKKDVLREIDRNAPPHAIIATNTSTIPITELALTIRRPEKFIGMHFFNPPQLMKLVEIVPGKETSDETVKRVKDFAEEIGKEVIICRKDLPGFVVNRILLPILDEAAWIVKRGEAEIIEVDSSMRYKVGVPMGPFELMDYIGLDVVYSVMREVKKRDPSLIIFCPLIEEYYRRGWWGRASGRGFYEYLGEGGGRIKMSREVGERFDPLKVLAPAANVIAKLIKEGVSSVEDINKATKLALGFPDGIIETFKKMGYQRLIDELDKKMSYDPEYYKPDEFLKEVFGCEKHSAEGGGRIILKREPPLAWIILSRPEKLNALTSNMMEELDKILGRLEGDEEIRVVILTGAGERAFSVGADIESFKELTRIDAERESRRWKEIITKLEKLSKPTIAAIKGYCLGCGLELALACDLRLAREDSMLGQPEIMLGLIPGAGGTQRLVRIIGYPRAKELLMLGSRISARRAEEIGLINRMYPAEKFEELVRELALELAEKPPIALKLLKHVLSLAGDYRVDEGYRFESQAFGSLFETEDLREGIDAFLAKRKPKFKGR